MARSRSRSRDGGSEQLGRPEPRLLKAIEEKRDDEAIAIIEHAERKQQHTEHLLRIGLMRAAERGNTYITEWLLKKGAKPDGAAAGRVGPLLKAVENNHVGIVQLLLRYGGDKDCCDKKGRTALMTAAWKNHFHVLNELLRCGADVNKKDKRQRNVLHNLAADKQCDWGRDVIQLLLAHNIAIDNDEGRDTLSRTPLHWAAVTGKKWLCEMLLMRPLALRAQINARAARDKTSLQLAIIHGREDIVEMLIRFSADVKAKSDGGWTALHNACEKDNVKTLRMLLEAGADINARLLNGMTPLHVAAENGHVDNVQCLLEIHDIKRAARDNFGITPFLRAAQAKRKEIVTLLAPFNNVGALSKDAIGALNGFNATIVDFGNFHNENKVTKRTVYELLYGRDPQNPRKPAVTVLPKDSKATNFRWIHFPANNMAWVEALLTKAFIEEGAHDVDGWRELERSFNHQHRGQQVHSHFMRPLCHGTPRAPKVADDSDLSDSVAETGPPQIIINGKLGLGIDGATTTIQPVLPRTPIRTDTKSTDQTDWTLGSTTSGAGKERKGTGKSTERAKKTSKTGSSKHAKSGTGDTPSRQSEHHKRKSSQPLSSSGHLRSPGSPGRRDLASVARGNIFMFTPYLHAESTRSRQEMQDAIARADERRRNRSDAGSRRPSLQRTMTSDEMLIRAHLNSSSVSLHVRRTLDQFFYHNIDTRSRDEDQVVYRYQMREANKGKISNEIEIDPKIFMVDQLWMWVLGKDLIVTAFPQRWQQPKASNDPLNVLDGIIEAINSKTREPVNSVYDLALTITARCVGVFDRSRNEEDYQFLDMFESSIGDATEKESKLFGEFNEASEQASQWLQHHRRPNRFSRHLEAEGRVIEHHNRHLTTPHSHKHALGPHPTHEDSFHFDDQGPLHAPLFVDKLLDIGAETDLLAETKDIRDELNMIARVLEDQKSVLPDLKTAITEIYIEEHRNQKDLKKRFDEQLKTVDVHLNSLRRMDEQAERIYKSITDLLDLKQKHANAFEARFARDQAAGTARQSQTIMVFTIVTIIFLPLSFIAAFFTINITEFPHNDQGNPSLPLSYVTRYMFPIGFAVSIPLVVIALSLDEIGDLFREARRRLADRRSRKRRMTVEMTAPPVPEIRYTFDTPRAERALSVGRSSRVGRVSHDSYLGGPLLPMSSHGTNRTAHVNGRLPRTEVLLEKGTPIPMRPPPIERQSTGFRIRKSVDAEHV